MKVLLTGGSGFTGKRVLDILKCRAGIELICLARSEDSKHFFSENNIRYLEGDVNNKESLLKAFQGIDVLINIVSLGFGHADNIVSAAEEAGINKAVFVSTTAIETSLNAKSKIVRKAAEKRINDSTLDWTIIRPTMIYGFPDDRNMIRLLKLLRKTPLVPIPGKGDFLQHPVHVCDVASAIVEAAFSNKTSGKTYSISGKSPITFNELIDTAAKALGTKVKLLHVPEKPVLLFFSLVEKIMKKPFLKKEQIERLLEDKSFSHEEASNDFSYNPRSFAEGISEEARISGLI